MRQILRQLIATTYLLILPGCGMVQGFLADLGPPPGTEPHSRMRSSALGRVVPSVRQEIDRLTPDAEAILAMSHESVDALPARFKRRQVVETLKRPWDGLLNLERQGLLAAELAEQGAVNLPGLLDVLEAGVDRTSAFHKVIALPTNTTSHDHVIFMLENLEEASRHREKAVEHLTEDEKHFLFAHARSLVEQYSPQISTFSERTIARAKADLRFAELVEEQVNYSDLIAAAQVLARMGNSAWLRQMATAFHQISPQAIRPTGITGDVLYVENTPYGLIVIGGTGPNTYELDSRFGLVIDLGGDDLYRGMIASSTDADHGNAILIDMAGNDTYIGTALGLATGRLGVGLLIDQSGDDVYQLDMGSGGTGFGGLGILLDEKGNDLYMGGRFTQGSAIAGLGLLLDGAGNDRYTSHGYAIGFGGPSGMGAVIDVLGDDHYQCGDTIPSAYNAEDAPNAKPGDPLFQYDCFGLGTGSGKRMLTKRPDWQALSLSGGWGLLLDIDGHDHYRSANFSQGHGYFFGVGTLLDLDGDDKYQAARYGHGSSAHYGVSLFTDRHGDDRYSSIGPLYNGGVAWDHGVSLILESGNGRDQYEFQSSTGLGRADYSGWGLFIDEGGADQYQAKSGFGSASDQGVGGFIDLSGNDRYQTSHDRPAQNDDTPGNGKTFRYPKGGVFVDRRDHIVR